MEPQKTVTPTYEENESSILPYNQLVDECSKQSGKETDFITLLPYDLLLHILSFLPLREAVRTSVLSTHFKFAWRYLPTTLIFDPRNILATPILPLRRYPTIHIPIFRQVRKPVCCGYYKQKLVCGVNQFIQSYQRDSGTGSSSSTKLNDLAVQLCLGTHDKEDIDRWISFGLQRNVRFLFLILYCDESSVFSGSYPRCRRKHKDHYVLHGDLFVGGSCNLEVLHLVGCRLAPDFSSLQFNKLDKLVLEYMRMACTSDNLQTMLHCMPKLRCLKIFNSRLPKKLSFGCLPLLQKLRVQQCFNIHEVELSNPALVKLSLWNSGAIKCNFSGAPNLRTIRVTVDTQDVVRCIYTRLSKYCPLLTSLSVFIRCDWFDSISQNISTFKQVQHLSLYSESSDRFDMVKFVTILRAFPLLCKLELQTYFHEFVECKQLDRGEFVHQHLKEVLIGGLFWRSDRIKSITHLLECVPALKKLTIMNYAITTNLKPFFMSWSVGEQEQVRTQLEEYFEGGFYCHNTCRRNIQVMFQP